MCADMAPDRVISALLVDPAGVEPRGTLFEFRIATLPFLGELLARPTYLATKMLWRKAFYNPTPFVTDELIEKKLELASVPGAQAAFLKTLRGFVEFRGFRPGPVAELPSSLPNIHTPCLLVWGANDQLVPASHAKVLKEVMPNIEVQI